MASMNDEGAAADDWGYLPAHILDIIAHNLIASDADSSANYIRFGAVCKLWRQVALHNFRKYPSLINIRRPHFLPFLMVPTEDSRTCCRQLLNVINLRERPVDVNIPMAYYNMRCCGSSHSWLAFAIEEPLFSLFVVLYNPFTGNTIHLPRLEEFPPEFHDDEADGIRPWRCDYWVDKVILSSDPTTNPDFMVLAVYECRCKLALFKSGDTSWTHLKLQDIDYIDDVAFHRGGVYVIDKYNLIVCFDYRNPARVQRFSDTREGIKEDTSHRYFIQIKFYLVESTNGCLYKVLKLTPFIEDLECAKAVGFEVHKLIHRTTANDEDDEQPARWWQHFEDIGGDAFFLGTNHSMLVKASDHIGCQPDSIYFTDDISDDICLHGPFDVGIFHLKQGKFGDPYYMLPSSGKHLPPAIWIEPRDFKHIATK